MCEHGQHGGEGAQACCEEDEEGELFLWVHRHLVERWSDGRGKKGDIKNVSDQQQMMSGEEQHVHSTHRAAAPDLLFLCILGRGKISDLSLVGRGLTGTL